MTRYFHIGFPSMAVDIILFPLTYNHKFDKVDPFARDVSTVLCCRLPPRLALSSSNRDSGTENGLSVGVSKQGGL